MADTKDLMDQVARLMADLQDATQLLDESAATELGLNLTDLRCARQILQGPKSPSQLAEATGLTRAAISTALDRLESANIARRVADPLDRRRSLVEPTERARRGIRGIWGPIERDGRQTLAGYSPAELEVIVDFLARSIDLQRKHTNRLQKPYAGTR